MTGIRVAAHANMASSVAKNNQTPLRITLMLVMGCVRFEVAPRFSSERSRVGQRRAAIPAQLELAGIGFSAGETMFDRCLRGPLFIISNHRTRVLLLMQL